jgi:conjugal transfer ATP-binding protein TraC
MKALKDLINSLFADDDFDDIDDQIFDHAALSRLLPYRVFDSKEHLYHNANSTGFILEIVPQLSTEDIVANLHSAISTAMPANSGIQFINWTSPNIRPQLDEWAMERVAGGELIERLTSSRIEHVMNLRFGTDQLKKAIPLKRRVFITGWTEGDASFSSIAALKSFRKAIAGAVDVDEWSSNLQPVELLSLLQEIFNATQWGRTDNATYTSELPLNQQLPGASVIVKPAYMALPGETPLAVNVSSISKFPNEWYSSLGLLLFGDPDRITDRPHGPTLTTLSAVGIGKEKTQTNLVKQIMLMDRAQKTGMNKFVNDFQGKYDEIANLQRETDSSERMFETSFTVAAFAKGEAEAAMAAGHEMAKIYRRPEFTLRHEKYLQLPMFLGALPLGMTQKHMNSYRSLMRMRLLKGKAVSALAPLQGEFVGNSAGAGVLLLGRQGEVFKYSNYVSEGNYNVAVVGKSGAGKSVFMQELITSIYANGGRALVIDDGYSFKTTCEILGGKHIAFDGSTNLKLNPFTMLDQEHMKSDEYRAEAANLIAQVVSSMVNLGVQKEGRVEGIEEEAIQYAILQVWDQKGPEGEITDVFEAIQQMSSDDERLLDVCRKLKTFCRGGQYGSYFTGPSNITIDSPFTVVELSDIKTQPALEQVVMQIIMFLGTELMFKTDRQTQVAILIDEAWDMLKGNGTDKFIEGVARRARKYSGALITGTQSLDDYTATPAAEACIQNSDWLVMMAQKPETIDKFMSSDKLSIDSGFARRLKTITSVPGSFSEMAIKGPSGWFFGRLLLDPFSLAVYSSKGSTVQKLKQRQAAGMTTVEAIEDMVKMGDVS